MFNTRLNFSFLWFASVVFFAAINFNQLVSTTKTFSSGRHFRETIWTIVSSYWRVVQDIPHCSILGPLLFDVAMVSLHGHDRDIVRFKVFFRSGCMHADVIFFTCNDLFCTKVKVRSCVSQSVDPHVEYLRNRGVRLSPT